MLRNAAVSAILLPFLNPKTIYQPKHREITGAVWPQHCSPAYSRQLPNEQGPINQFYFFPNSVLFCYKWNFSGFRFFPVLNFLDSFLMIKLNCINQKACLIIKMKRIEYNINLLKV